MSISTQPEPHAIERDMLITSTILFGLMILEYIWNMRFEIKVIWPGIRKSGDIKIFMIVRYMGLISQIFNIWFVTRMASGIPNHPIVCKAWLGYQAAITQTLTLSSQLLLMLRVLHIYNHHKYVYGIFIALVGAQFAVMTVIIRMVVPSINHSPTCTVVKSHDLSIYLAVSTIAVHLCLLVMILWRYFRGDWREPLRSLFKIMVRDCTCLVILVTGDYLPVTIPVRLEAAQTSMNILFIVMIFTLWFAICNLVLQKEKFRHQMDCDLEFTIVDLDNLEPSIGSDICPPEPSKSNIVLTEVRSVDIDAELGIVTKDISDERLSDRVDD